MAQKQQEVLVSSGAGLGAAIGVESGPELGDAEAVKALGYWELVWIRFRRDKIAIVHPITGELLGELDASPAELNALARLTGKRYRMLPLVSI